MELSRLGAATHSPKDVEDYVFRYLVEGAVESGAQLDMNTDYRRAGYVDSFSYMRFISALEQEFGIEFSDDEIISSDIRTVGGVIDCIIVKLGSVRTGVTTPENRPE